MQFEDRVRLLRGERLLGIEFRSAAAGVDVDLLAAEIGHQVLARFATIGAAANDRDHVVQVIERGQVTFQDVLAVFGFLQQECCAAAHDFYAMIDEVLDGRDQSHFLGLPAHNCQQDHTEAFLHLGVLEELVEHDLRFGAALQFDHDAHAVAVTLVANVGDIVDDFVVDQVGNALDQLALFTWKGISVTMMACLSLVMVSIAALARIMKRPRPVL